MKSIKTNPISIKKIEIDQNSSKMLSFTQKLSKIGQNPSTFLDCFEHFQFPNAIEI